MLKPWFYNETIKNTTALFGTLFNDIKIVRPDAKGYGNPAKVPLAYGPKKKYIARIDQEPKLDDPKIAVKLPRMAFEMVDIQYDTTASIQPHKTHIINGQKVYNPVPYRLSFELGILADNQSDMLQIVEQILPTFQPTYTVSAYIHKGFNRPVDVPFTLESISIENDYEGDFRSRQVLINTLMFDVRISLFGGQEPTSLIKDVYVAVNNMNTEEMISAYRGQVDPADAEPDEEYSIVETVEFVDRADVHQYNLLDPNDHIDQFKVGGLVVGQQTGTVAEIHSIDPTNNMISLWWADNDFIETETISTEVDQTTYSVELAGRAE